jgi:hypothetical protein
MKQKKIKEIQIIGKGKIATINHEEFYEEAEQIEDKIFIIFEKLNEVIRRINHD